MVNENMVIHIPSLPAGQTRELIEVSDHNHKNSFRDEEEKEIRMEEEEDSK